MQLAKPILKLSILPIAALAMGMALTEPASSAGDSDSSSDNADTTKPKKPLFAVKCKEGKVWVKAKLRCMEEEEAKKLEQSSIYETGRDLAYIGEYDKAIRWLTLAPDQSDPRVNNMLGFSNRKLGNMDVALAHYYKAINADPDYSLVREYLGEAYIQLGMLEKAREQLTEIERICGGRSCEEYGKLAELMVDSQSKL